MEGANCFRICLNEKWERLRRDKKNMRMKEKQWVGWTELLRKRTIDRSLEWIYELFFPISRAFFYISYSHFCINTNWRLFVVGFWQLSFFSVSVHLVLFSPDVSRDSVHYFSFCIQKDYKSHLFIIFWLLTSTKKIQDYKSTYLWTTQVEILKDNEFQIGITNTRIYGYVETSL